MVHVKHINMVMKALANVKLFCNKKKCQSFMMELNFLEHHISACGIELNSSKIQRILNWPTPGNSTDIHTFLGLVCYIVNFLPTLANYTHVLTPLLTKEAKSNFVWNEMHQITFESIKSLVVSINCLTVIDHCDPNNKIFMACDASDWQTGACLSF